MKIISIIYCILVTLLISGLLLFVEQGIFNKWYFIPIVESLFIFFAVLILHKLTEENVIILSLFVGFFFSITELLVYILAVELGMVDVSISISELISWRLLYNSAFWIASTPILCAGLREKDKVLWVLFIIIGISLHFCFNLIMSMIF